MMQSLLHLSSVCSIEVAVIAKFEVGSNQNRRKCPFEYFFTPKSMSSTGRRNDLNLFVNLIYLLTSDGAFQLTSGTTPLIVALMQL